MKEIKIESTIKCFDLNELDEKDQALVYEAIQASKQAYAPYSEFYVGAAVRLQSGDIIQGSNQENAAYPSGICAERTALFACGHLHPKGIIDAIAITAHSQKYKVMQPVSPCGACRQVMAEYRNKQDQPIRILLHGQSGLVYECEDVNVLLPFIFSLKS